jgi:predicted ester cyclase
VTGATGTGDSDTGGSRRDRAECLVRSYLASFASGDPDAVAAHVSDDFVNDHTAALGSGCVGVAEYRKRLPGFLAGFPGLSYLVDALIVDPDGTRAAATYRMTATSEGHPIGIRGCMVFEIDLAPDGESGSSVTDGTAGSSVRDRIARRTDYWDSLVYLRQVGQAPDA